MAHFAQLNENNVVIQVIVVNNDVILDNGVESELKGIDFCKLVFGQDTKWVQTSYNGSFRKNYAGVGMIYNQEIDAFVEVQPFLSWSLNNAIGKWEAPNEYPTDGIPYQWCEELLRWESIAPPVRIEIRNVP